MIDKTFLKKANSKDIMLKKILLLSLLFSLIPNVSAEIFDGDTVYINDSQAYISATPHTVVGTSPVVIEWEAKNYNGNINILFGYNGEYLRPYRLDRWNPHTVEGVIPETNETYSYIENWTKVNVQGIDFIHRQFNFDGKTDWYAFTNVNVVAGQRYKYRIWIEAPSIPIGMTQAEVYPDYDGKWDAAFYPSAYGTNVLEAIGNGHFYFLDPTVELTTGLVSYYTLDSDATDSVGTNDGTAGGNASNEAGFINNGYYFDGNNDYINIPDDNSLDLDGSLSISYWVKRNGNPSGNMIVFEKWKSTTGRNWVNWIGTGGNLVFQVYDGTTAVNLISSGTVVDNQYHHIVAIRNSSSDKLQLFIDGVEDGASPTSDTTTGSIINDQPARIGLRIDNSNDFLGYIDEVGIWSKALTTAEISALYNSGAGLQYPFSVPATGISINESTLNVTNAYLNGTVWRTNKASPVILQTTQPTVTFTISTAGNCSIGLNNLNYSAMISADSNTQCSTTDSVNQSCTLPTSQSMPWVASDSLYIACSEGTYYNETGALTFKRIPQISNIQLSESYYLNLDADGTNYGEASEGWSNLGESKLRQLWATKTSQVHYLIVKATRLDASLNFYLNDVLVGNIPSDSGGTGEWDIYAFNVSASLIQQNNTLNITAPSSNIDDTYIDFIALSETSTVSDGVVPNSTLMVLYLNVTNTSVIDVDNGLVYYENGTLKESPTSLNYNTITDVGYGNRVFVYETPNSVDEIYQFKYQTNFTNFDPYLITQDNKTVTIDSTAPVIETITTDLSPFVTNFYPITVNVTETNKFYLEVYSNDSSITRQNMTFVSGLYNTTLIYSKPYSHTITTKVEDKAGHVTSYSFSVKSSNASYERTFSYVNPYSYSNYITVADSPTAYDVAYKYFFNITTYGNAYINDYNITLGVNDTEVFNYTLTYANGTNDTSLFADGISNLEWTTEPFNNTLTNPLIFNNTISYYINDSISLEWENSGVNNIRLFHATLTNKNTSMINTSVFLPLRTTYSGNSSSIDLFVCTSGLNWGAKTCGQWSEITTKLYNRTDETYHWGNNASQYPTIDFSDDGNKDTLILKIPSISPNGQVMYKVDLDSSNAEPTWAGGNDVINGTPTETPSGGGGGGGGSSEEETPTTVALPSSTGSSGGLLSGITGFFGDVWDGIKSTTTGLIDGFTGGLDLGNSFLLLMILIVLALVFLFLSNTGDKTVKSKGFEI